MVRSSHEPVLLALAVLLLLPACGGDEAQTFQLAITSPVAARTEVPFPVAVVSAVATSAETLTLNVSAGDETYAFAARPGTTLAFRLDSGPTLSPVKLEGLEAEAQSPSEVGGAFETRLTESASEAAVRKPAGGDAFVVDLSADREDLWPAIIQAAASPAELRFLIEVLPREQYRPWRGDFESAPRLAAPPYPWSGTSEAFVAFKEAEVARWRAAKASGQPYVPSRADLLVLPRAGTAAADVQDFAVLEWPAIPEHRFDGRMLANPLTATDPNTGKPIVLYDVREPFQQAFGDWTGANVGLPMAIVLDWVYLSAPTINSALWDNVQITLGAGTWAELQAEARALTRTLGGAAEGPPATLVAVCTWHPGGVLEVLLPLEERVDTRLTLEARGASPSEQGRVERTLRRVPELEAAVADAVDARLAELRLGLLTADVAAPLLRGDAEAATRVLAAMATSDASLGRRAAAVQLLGRVAPSSGLATRTLVTLLSAGEPVLVRRVVEALEGPARHTQEAFAALLRVVASEDATLRGWAHQALDGSHPSQRDWLRAAAADDDPSVRVAALTVLSATYDPDLVPQFLEWAQDVEGRVRLAATSALYGLVEFGGASLEAEVEALSPLLADEEEGVRGNVAMVLGKIGEPAVSAILRELERGPPRARAAALLAFHHMDEHPPEVLAILRRLLEDPSLRIRIRAASALHRATGEIDPALDAVADFGDADEETRAGAVQWLWWVAPQARRAAPWLRPLLDDEVEDIRVFAAAALERMGEADARTRAILDPVKADPEHPLHGIETWTE